MPRLFGRVAAVPAAVRGGAGRLRDIGAALVEDAVHRPGTPYSYGPPTTVGIASKLKIGGGDVTCHSSVSAFHGLDSAIGPPRHEAIML